MALAGRAMEPGISAYTVGHALQMFALLALWPALTLLRLWGGRLRIIFITAVLPVSLILAFAAAGIEEFIFVQKYKASGVGPTGRWTIPIYWLSYDAQTGTLSGSD